MLLEHSYGRRTADNPTARCPLCPGEHGGPGPCDHHAYTRQRLRFIRIHQEAYSAAYLSPDPQAASNELERLSREYRTLPPRHDCSCWPEHCRACAALGAQRPRGSDVAVSIGRGSLVNAPCPMVLMLDVEAGYAA